MSASIKAASKVLKFIAIASVAAFCVLASNHYYQIKQYSQNLLPELNMTVFLDKNCEDGAKVCDAIGALGFVNIDEYVRAEEAYLKAVEKNPFLKDISVPGDSEVFQPYIKASPMSMPTEEFLIAARNAVAQVDDVSEVVFNPGNFKQYERAVNILSFYQRLIIVFSALMLIMLIIQSILFIFESEENTRKLVTNSIAYLVAASAGFVGMWSVCLFAQYPILIDETAAFFIIPLSAALGIIFKD